LRSVPIHPQHNVQQLQSWMNTCISSHTKCSQFQQLSTESSERPSRILQINGDQLKLRCDVLQLENCSYLTLSHMWGSEPTKQLVLTEANLASYQDGIALETLPAIFRKAVSLTQLLGHEYLWIDSLCIIQDSLTDWEAEASKMASTYGNSLCNLTCIVPPDRFHQEQQHDPRVYIPCVVRPATVEGSGLYVMPEYIYSRSYKAGFACNWHRPLDWPLFSRAWYVIYFEAKMTLAVHTNADDLRLLPQDVSGTFPKPTDHFLR
jgi:hypothetical protein